MRIAPNAKCQRVHACTRCVPGLFNSSYFEHVRCVRVATRLSAGRCVGLDSPGFLFVGRYVCSAVYSLRLAAAECVMSRFRRRVFCA